MTRPSLRTPLFVATSRTPLIRAARGLSSARVLPHADVGSIFQHYTEPRPLRDRPSQPPVHPNAALCWRGVPRRSDDRRADTHLGGGTVPRHHGRGCLSWAVGHCGTPDRTNSLAAGLSLRRGRSKSLLNRTTKTGRSCSVSATGVLPFQRPVNVRLQDRHSRPLDRAEDARPDEQLNRPNHDHQHSNRQRSEFVVKHDERREQEPYRDVGSDDPSPPWNPPLRLSPE